DDETLHLSRALEREREPLEEGLGPALRLAGHELHEPRHAASASKRAATSSQLSPCCRASAASCCARHSASSVRSAMAAAAKRSSSPATLPVTPSMIRSAT